MYDTDLGYTSEAAEVVEVGSDIGSDINNNNESVLQNPSLIGLGDEK